jgi:hydroxymethylpyrimidine/phosphomethylpyrimidine kinase
MLSAASAAGLAKGGDLPTAVDDAKRFVTAGIEHSLALGKGIGPVNPGWRA